MERKELLSELKEMALIDLLEIYVEAKTGTYKDFMDELTTDTLHLIEELEEQLDSLTE